MNDKQVITFWKIYCDTEGYPLSLALTVLRDNPRLHGYSDEVIDEFRTAADRAIEKCVDKWPEDKTEDELKAYTTEAIGNACKDAVKKIRRRIKKVSQFARTESDKFVEYEDKKPATLDNLTPQQIAKLARATKGIPETEIKLFEKNPEAYQPKAKKPRRKLKYEDIQLHDLHYNFGVLEWIDGCMIETPSTQKQTAANERKPVTSVQRILDYVERATDDERQLLLLEAWGGPDELEF